MKTVINSLVEQYLETGVDFLHVDLDAYRDPASQSEGPVHSRLALRREPLAEDADSSPKRLDFGMSHGAIPVDSDFQFGADLELAAGEKQALLFTQSLATVAKLKFLCKQQSELTLIFVSEAASRFDLDFELGENAELRLNLVLIENLELAKNLRLKQGPDERAIQVQPHFTLEASARCDLHAVILDGNASIKSQAELRAPGANFNYASAIFAHPQSQHSYEVETHHQAAKTFSQIRSHAVLDHDATVELISRGRIERSAAGSQCRQDMKGICLDETGTALCYPLLFIDEYDIEASHASGVGQIDDDSLFYLMSRGLSEAEAKRLMMRAFLEAILTGVSDVALSSFLHQRLDRMIEEC
ncbi:MAG: SufD family Fe-S cluster assembly protein [Eubacteriales bacterium]|nr:SufD family Fe-S cluster assembly protein [Eubacteriales bacterium]